MSPKMNIPKFKLPSLVARIGSHLPQWPHSVTLIAGLNIAAKMKLLPLDSLALLEGRSFLVEVLDTGGRAYFTYHDGSVPSSIFVTAETGSYFPRQPFGFHATAGPPGRPRHSFLQPRTVDRG